MVVIGSIVLLYLLYWNCFALMYCYDCYYWRNYCSDFDLVWIGFSNYCCFDLHFVRIIWLITSSRGMSNFSTIITSRWLILLVTIIITLVLIWIFIFHSIQSSGYLLDSCSQGNHVRRILSQM